MGAVWSKAQSEVVEASLGIAAACGVRWASVAAHELAHFLVAQWLGYEASIHLGALTSLPPHVHVHGITSCARHAALVVWKSNFEARRIDATLSPVLRLLDGVEVHEGLSHI